MRLDQQLFSENYNQIRNVGAGGKLLRKADCPWFNYSNQGQ
jgi:hypothetical protein